MDSSDFEKAIRKGDFEAVKFLIDNENCDINQNIAHYVDPLGNIYFQRPLSFTLQNIQYENDKSFKISKMLLEHSDFNVNAQCCISNNFGFNNSTVLGEMCCTECESLLGVNMLLGDPRTNVNAGGIMPLYCALRNIKKEGDYFYQVSEMLLKHRDIDVNAELRDCQSILSRLCTKKTLQYME